MQASEVTRILFAEDDEAVAALVVFKLKRAGFEITHVLDGALAAQELARAAREARPYGFAILDGRLPGRDGVSIMDECAAFGWTDGGVLASADELRGVVLPPGWICLRKPFDLGDLVAAVKSGAGGGARAEETEHDVFLRLKSEFAATFPSKVAEIEALLATPDGEDRRRGLESVGHKLSGAAGLYHYQNLYQAAVALEESCTEAAARNVIVYLCAP